MRTINLACLLGCIIAVGIDFGVVLALDQPSIFATTISELAAGEFAWLQDFGLFIIATVLIATGYLLWRLRAERHAIGLAAGALAIAGGAIILLAVYEQYGETTPDAPVIHTWVLTLVGLSITIALGTVGISRGHERRLYRWFTLVCAGIWFLTGSSVFGIPSEWDGLAERLASSALLIWLVSTHVMIYRDQVPFASPKNFKMTLRHRLAKDGAATE